MTAIANTTTNTTLKNVRLKLNEVIGRVNTLGVGNVSNSYLTSTYVSNSTFQAFVANTNAYIASTAGTGEVSNATFQAFVANTNAYIKTRATWSSLTGTNTALRTLISDRIQVANVQAKYATKAYAASNSYVKLLLANTNAYIADVQASITAANEISQDIIDYGFITSSTDVNINRDYGTL